MGFFVVLLFILIFFLWSKVNNLEDRIDAIVKRDIERQKEAKKVKPKPIEEVNLNMRPEPVLKEEKPDKEKTKIENKKSDESIIEEEIQKEEIIHEEIVPEKVFNEKSDKTFTEKVEIDQKKIKVTKPIKQQNKKKSKSLLWKKTEKLFLENWTGILGAIFVVAGTGFLGVYAALKVKPIVRFFMLSGLSTLLYFISFKLDKKEYWKDISLWIRSCGAAIFLFGCIGAGGLEALKFINDPAKALLMILIGIALNLMTAYINKKQIFASTHVLLSMIALMIAVPAASVSPMFSIVLFSCAALITAISFIPLFYSLWKYHLFVSLLSFEVFHIYWYSNLLTPVQNITNIIAISGFCLIGFTGILAHYQKIYQNNGFPKRVFFDHTLTWMITAVGIYLHRLGTPFTSVILLLLAIATYINSRRAKQNKIRWLFITDAIISQILAFLSAISAYDLGVDINIIAVLLTIELFLYSYITLKEKDLVLIKTATFFIYLISVFNFYVFLRLKTDNSLISTLLLIISYCLYVYYTKEDENVFALEKDLFSSIKDENSIDLTGVITGLLPILVINEVIIMDIRSLIITPVFISLTILSRTLRKDGLLYSLMISCFISILFFTNEIGNLDILHKQIIEWSVLLISTYIMMYLNYSKDKSCRVIRPCIVLTLFITLLYSYRIFKIHDIKYLNLSWLGFSLYYLFLSIKHRFLDDHENTVFSTINLYCGYIIMGLFIFRNVFIRPTGQVFYRFITFNNAVDILAIIGFMTWFYFDKSDVDQKDEIDVNLRPLFLELSVMMTTFVLYSLSPSVYSALTLSILTFVFVFIGLKKERLSRLCLYSYIPLILSMFLNIKTVITLPSEMVSKTDYIVFLTTGLSYLIQVGFGLFNREGRLLTNVKPVYPDRIFVRSCESIRKGAPFLIYLFTFYSAIFVIYFFKPISDLIPSIALLILAILYLEYSSLITRKYNNNNRMIGSSDEHLMVSSFVFITVFLFRHFIVDIQSGVYIMGMIPIKTLVQIFSGGCLIYMISSELPDSKKERTLYQTIFPLSLEILIGLAIAGIYINFNPGWQHLALIGLSFIMFFAGKIKYLSRLKFYSFFPYMMSIVHTVFIVSTYKNPSLNILGKTWMKGVIGIIIQLGFLILIYRDRIFEENKFPKSISFLRPISKKMSRFYEYLTFYPLIIGIAMFFFYSFDRSILTLLWMLEAFAIFVISLILSNDHFRYISMTAVGFCLLRVIFYDLAKADTLARAIVFIGSGIILIVMNTIYNKYKGNIKNEE